MTRQDLGFVISRAMAVWLLVMVLQNLVFGAQVAILFSRSEGYSLVDVVPWVCLAGITFGLAWLLWFRADVLAGTQRSEVPQAMLVGQDLLEALCGAIGLYYAVSGFIIGLQVAGRALVDAPVHPQTQGYGFTWFDAATDLVIGVAVMLIFSPTIRAAIAGFWRLPPEEGES